jgi:hypothetical protein
MRAVKFITPFLILALFAITGCETIQNRRSLYAPLKASGPYTESLKTGSWRRGEYPAPKVAPKKEEPLPPDTLAAPIPG